MLKKQNSFDDFASCAEYLHAAGYSSPGKLTIQVLDEQLDCREHMSDEENLGVNLAEPCMLLKYCAAPGWVKWWSVDGRSNHTGAGLRSVSVVSSGFFHQQQRPTP